MWPRLFSENVSFLFRKTKEKTAMMCKVKWCSFAKVKFKTMSITSY